MSIAKLRARLEELALDGFSEVEVTYFDNGKEVYESKHINFVVSPCVTHINAVETTSSDIEAYTHEYDDASRNIDHRGISIEHSITLLENKASNERLMGI